MTSRVEGLVKGMNGKELKISIKGICAIQYSLEMRKGGGIISSAKIVENPRECDKDNGEVK